MFIPNGYEDKLLTANIEDEGEAIDYNPSEPSTQFYPHNNQFAPPPSSQAYPPQQGQPEYAYAPNGNIPAYNPAEYGPTTGPTLPREDPYAHRPPHDPYAQQDHYEEGYPRDPEHVSAPRAFEHSEPGTFRAL
jgi:hypothetical protein